MVKATQLHFEFLKQYNSQNSNFDKAISVVMRDSYLNHAKDVVIENFFAIPETNPTVRNHLRQLEVKRASFEIIRNRDDYVVFRYPKSFYRLIRSTVKMVTKDCSTPREILVHPVKTHQLTEALKDPYWEPSFEWEETLGEEGHDGFYIYKKPEHTIQLGLFDYFRKPADIAAPSLLDDAKCYTNAKGEKICHDKDFEIDSTFLWRKIVDVAVLYALRDTNQLQDFESKLKEILFTDKLYLT